MKRILSFSLILLSFDCFSNPRIDRDITAKKKLETLNFFYKGRGMEISTDMIKI